MSDLIRIGALLRKYADLRADFADVSLAWVAQRYQLDKIVTVGERDFSICRARPSLPSCAAQRPMLLTASG